MGPILGPYLKLALGSLITVAMQFIQEQGPTLATKVAEHVTASAQGKPWWAFLASVFGVGLIFKGGRELHKAPPPLEPTPVETPDTNRKQAEAVGEAFARASKQPFSPKTPPAASDATPAAAPPAEKEPL